jgi:hypothetical protein
MATEPSDKDDLRGKTTNDALFDDKTSGNCAWNCDIWERVFESKTFPRVWEFPRGVYLPQNSFFFVVFSRPNSSRTEAFCRHLEASHMLLDG